MNSQKGWAELRCPEQTMKLFEVKMPQHHLVQAHEGPASKLILQQQLQKMEKAQHRALSL